MTMAPKVHALTETDYLRPDGDCYAPQILLTQDFGNRWNTTELNTGIIPVLTAADVVRAFVELGRDAELTARWCRIISGCSVIAVDTTGFSQGDYGTSFVFAPPTWLEMTGAPGITPEDAHDLAAWVWGDVYEVFEEGHTKDYSQFGTNLICSCGQSYCEDDYRDGESLYVYGMEAASKYGEIIFPTTHSYETYED